MPKQELRDSLLEQLAADYRQQTAAAQLSRDEAISEESRAENKYDTHSQEAAYLAEGQARLAQEIENARTLLANFEFPDFAPDATIAIGALVELHATNERASRWYLLCPAGGGTRLKLKEATPEVLVLTPGSPLGRQLVGKRRGDIVALTGRSRPEKFTIISVG